MNWNPKYIRVLLWSKATTFLKLQRSYSRLEDDTVCCVQRPHQHIIFESYIYLYLLGDNLGKDYFTCIFLMLFYNIKLGKEVNHDVTCSDWHCKQSKHWMLLTRRWLLLTRRRHLVLGYISSHHVKYHSDDDDVMIWMATISIIVIIVIKNIKKFWNGGNTSWTFGLV